MIQLTGEKMAKSAGNIAPLHEVLDGYGAEAVLMYLVSGHYRQPLAFSVEELQDAARKVHRVRDALRRLAPGQASPADMSGHRDVFLDALANDFNTPAALAALFEWVREANRRGSGVGDADLREMLGLLGLGELTPLQALGDVAAIDPDAVSLLEQREQARRERDFQAADRMREELRMRGWEIRDGPSGPELIPAATR
jgi:cysteinyl-tRNA synthetase